MTTAPGLFALIKTGAKEVVKKVAPYGIAAYTGYETGQLLETLGNKVIPPETNTDGKHIIVVTPELNKANYTPAVIVILITLLIAALVMGTIYSIKYCKKFRNPTQIPLTEASKPRIQQPASKHKIGGFKITQSSKVYQNNK